jgi:hypothetical protein
LFHKASTIKMELIAKVQYKGDIVLYASIATCHGHYIADKCLTWCFSATLTQLKRVVSLYSLEYLCRPFKFLYIDNSNILLFGSKIIDGCH